MSVSLSSSSSDDDSEKESGVEENGNDEQSMEALLRQRERLMAQLKEASTGDEDSDQRPPKRMRLSSRTHVDLSSDSSDDDFVSVADDNELEEEDFDVDVLLEEPFRNGLLQNDANDKNKVPDCNLREKRVLKHRSTEYFEVLPDGWIEITHQSGLPVYLHKLSRVCTFARPYFIGPGSVRNHDVPLAAVPCLHQQKARQLQEEKAAIKDTAEPNSCLAELGAPAAKLQTGDEFRERNLTAESLYDYASNRFEFETVKVVRFERWENARTYHKHKRSVLEAHQASSNLGRPVLPGHVQLITVPSMDVGSKPQHKQFFLNPQGKTSIAVLHEYVQKVLKGLVHYEFSETRNASQPYSATVSLQSPSDRVRRRSEIKQIIERLKARQTGAQVSPNPSTAANGTENYIAVGTGFGNSKKAAKLDAAKKALEVLVPGVVFDEDYLAGTDAPQDGVVALFDLIPLADSRIPELSAKAGQPSPFVVLHECLKRNNAFGDTTMDTKTDRLKHQQHQFTMTVGKHQVQVVCSNKKEGKQKAAQAMLQKLHPQINTWGSLIRLYGYGAQRKLQESRKKKDSIIRLQGSKGSTCAQPNQAILDKLRKEMDNLYESPNSVQNQPTTDGAEGRISASMRNIDI